MSRLGRVLGLTLLTTALAFLLGLPTQTQTSPNVNLTTHGYMTQDEIWRGEMHVTGDLVVNKGVTLTIEPGTRVLVAANSDAENLFTDPILMKKGLNMTGRNQPGTFVGEPYQDQGNHIWIVVRGILHAVGTPDQIITITSDSPNPTRYDWTGIAIWHGTMKWTIMEYYWHFGPKNRNPEERVVVSDCILRHVGACAVCLGADEEGKPEAGVVIERSTLSDAGHELIDTHNAADAVVHNNHLGPNPLIVNPGGYERGGNGIILDGSAPQLVGNTIEGCECGVSFISPSVLPYDVSIPQLCRDNTFTGNQVNIQDHNGKARSCP